MAVLCRLSYSSEESMIQSDSMRRRLPTLVLSLAGLVLAGCGGGPPGEPATPAATVPTASPSTPSPAGSVDPLFDRGTVIITTGSGDVVLDVEIARTDAAHEKGLMGRTELAADAGMVFLFAEEQPRAFWMKDTLIPLSIAFYDGDGRIVTLLDMEPCPGDPCPLYGSGEPAMGALEVNAGAFEALGVGLGDVVRVEA
jgi:uncharacterized protein